MNNNPSNWSWPLVTLDGVMGVVGDIPCLLQVPSLMDGLGHLMNKSLGVGVVVGVTWVGQDKYH